MYPLRRWESNFEPETTSFGAQLFRQGGDPDKVRRIQSTAAAKGNHVWELDRPADGASAPYRTGENEPDWLSTTPVEGTERQDGNVMWKVVSLNGSIVQARTPKVYPPLLWADAPLGDDPDKSDTGSVDYAVANDGNPYNDHNLISAYIGNCLFINPYELMRFERKNNLTVVENCMWSAFRRGFWLDNASGIPRLSRLHGTNLVNIAQGVPDDKGSQVTETAVWISENLVAYEFGYLDWIRGIDLFTHRSKIGFRFSETPVVPLPENGSACRGQFFACGAEVCSENAVVVEATNATEGVTFFGGMFASETGTPATVHVVGTAGNPSPFLRLIGGQIGGGSASRHLWQQNGRVMLSHVQFIAPATTGNVVVATGSDEFHMSHCVFEASAGSATTGLNVQTGITARVFLTANDLKSTTYNNPAAKPTTYRAVGNVGIDDANLSAIPAYHQHGTTTVTFLEGGTAQTWSAMPAAQTSFQGVDRWRARVDLAAMTQIRISAHVLAAGHTDAKLRVRYSTDDSSFTSFATCECPISATGTKDSGWVNLATAMKVDNLTLQLMGIGGNASASPQLAMVRAEFR